MAENFVRNVEERDGKRDFPNVALDMGNAGSLTFGHVTLVPGTFYAMARPPIDVIPALCDPPRQHRVLILPGTMVEGLRRFPNSLTVSSGMVERGVPSGAGAFAEAAGTTQVPAEP